MFNQIVRKLTMNLPIPMKQEIRKDTLYPNFSPIYPNTMEMANPDINITIGIIANISGDNCKPYCT